MKKVVLVVMVIAMGLFIGNGCELLSNIGNDNDDSNNSTDNTDNSHHVSVTNGDGSVTVYGNNTDGTYGTLMEIPAAKK